MFYLFCGSETSFFRNMQLVDVDAGGGPQIKFVMTYYSLNARYFLSFCASRGRRRSDFVSIDLSLGRFRRVHISIATVGPHCTGALVCTVTYWWLTETVVPPWKERKRHGNEGNEAWVRGATVIRRVRRSFLIQENSWNYLDRSLST